MMILVTPLLLILTTTLVFRSASKIFGKEKGYLIGFGFYWLFWCLAIPWLLTGKDFASLLTNHLPLFSPSNWLAALIWIIVTVVTMVMYGKSFIKAPLTLILLAIPLATLNGFGEEILWRGMFVQAFPGNPWLGVLYPAVGFALWHLAPQSVFPAENKTAFILSTLFLGLAYGFIAHSTGSAFWTAISHSLGGILALGGMLVPTILKLMGRTVV
jgi:membrane protease YdiL (CAAX protease family)